jgi:hypothetical protein
VRARRRELGDVGEAFVPQHREPGAEAEVDWSDPWATIDGERVKVHLFQPRLCHSGAAFAAALRNETQQAFLEAHAEAFEFLGGLPALIRCDNLSSALKQVLKGCRRVESEGFAELRSHYAVSVAGSLDELNAPLRAGREADLARQITGPLRTVGEALAAERPLLPVADERARAEEEATPRVDATAMITVRQDRSSVAVELVGLRVLAQIGARQVTVSYLGKPLPTTQMIT